MFMHKPFARTLPEQTELWSNPFALSPLMEGMDLAPVWGEDDRLRLEGGAAAVFRVTWADGFLRKLMYES